MIIPIFTQNPMQAVSGKTKIMSNTKKSYS